MAGDVVWDSISEWSGYAVEWAVEQGVTVGTSDTTFSPRRHLHARADCDVPLQRHGVNAQIFAYSKK
ncbi:MAG: S-layer homology domain-containing protein [Oscillospiraceae bacterium]|nr:S-layer homology domain-containing protein [Oscillospiraceae bacterium]